LPMHRDPIAKDSTSWRGCAFLTSVYLCKCTKWCRGYGVKGGTKIFADFEVWPFVEILHAWSYCPWTCPEW
jgi:hypothetical protein